VLFSSGHCGVGELTEQSLDNLGTVRFGELYIFLNSLMIGGLIPGSLRSVMRKRSYCDK